MGIDDLVGKSVRVVIHEGTAPLADELEIIGIVTRPGPKGGPYKDYGVVIQIAGPQLPHLQGHWLFVTPRYKGLPLPTPDNSGRVIVNVALYSPSDVVVARAIGGLEILSPNTDREAR